MPRPIQSSEVGVAADVLARAFRDNPGMLAMFDRTSADARLRMLELSMRSFVSSMRRGAAVEVLDQEGRIGAVSLAYPPESFPPSLATELTMVLGPLRAGPRRFLRMLTMDAWMRQWHPRIPHWYLWFLGVVPELQGRGLGSALLRSLHARADEAQLPCYLEADKPSGVALYRRHGYEVQREVTHPSYNVRLWLMQRDPRP